MTHWAITAMMEFEKELDSMQSTFSKIKDEHKGDIEALVARDDFYAKCLWAINVLQKAYVEDVAKNEAETMAVN